MIVKFLPIHSKMRPAIKSGMRVVHNGGGSRQGWLGKVYHTTANGITVRFISRNKSQEYSWDWFLNNFYISILAVDKMKGIFNGEGYCTKYKLFCVSHEALKGKQRNRHSDNKALADARDGGYTSVVADRNECTNKEPEPSPLDEVGEYYLVQHAKLLPQMHKTQRLAEIAASKLTKESRSGIAIFKLVAETKPVCEAEIIRK